MLLIVDNRRRNASSALYSSYFMIDPVKEYFYLSFKSLD